MNEIAKGYWDLATAWLQTADEHEDINYRIAYTGQAEFALKAAQFAIDHPELVMGLDAVPMPDAGTPYPAGPTQGPRLWGAPK